MLSFLPAPVRGVLALSLIVLNTVVLIVPLLVVTLLKLLLPMRFWQRWMAAILVLIAENWIAINNAILALTQKLELDVDGLENLRYHGWYLVSCNHRSWVDILILQRVFNKRIPILKFFLKQELIWVPLLGVAWWALDFPFMKRYSKELLERRPELKGKDLETTKQACKKFQDIPVSIMNFLEGTRFTEAKHDAQVSPYQHLLKPKSGGVAFVLSVMGEQIRSMLDVTIVYHHQNVGLWDLLSGQIRHVTVRIQERPIPCDLVGGDYESDPEFRAKIQSWVSQLWLEKDQLISEILKD